MNIRAETQQDFDEIYDLVKIAFQTAQVSAGTEQDYVLQLRASGNYIPGLALVAETENQIIGHIMLTRQVIKNENGADFEGLLLAPLSVLLLWRDQGIGTRLTLHSFELARARGHTAVFVVGNPAYYQRFGFRSSAEFGIFNTGGLSDEYVMACELVPDALRGVSGSISF